MYTVLEYSMFYVNSLQHMCLISILVETPFFPLKTTILLKARERRGILSKVLYTCSLKRWHTNFGQLYFFLFLAIMKYYEDV